jgi:hypothetical protein
VARQQPTGGAEPEGGGERDRARRGFLLRLPPELLAELRTWANQDLRSLNAHIEFLLREALRRRRGSSDDA